MNNKSAIYIFLSWTQLNNTHMSNTRLISKNWQTSHSSESCSMWRSHKNK